MGFLNMTHRIYRTFAAIFILAAGLLLSGCSLTSDSGVQTETPAQAANTGEETSAHSDKDTVSFQTVTLEGETVDESIFADAKLTMINVWATYCSPCINEMPELGQIAEDYADKDFQMVGMISDVQEGTDVTDAKELVSETGADYTHLLLNQEVYETFLQDVTAVPTTFFVDEEGNQVGERYVGAKSGEEWVEIIEALLE